jgi:copper resistance protein B
MAGGLPDDPLLFKLMVDKAEVADPNGDSTFVWEADAWLGKDLNKLWFKTEGESKPKGTEEGKVELLYSRAIAPFWDLQAGWRHDFAPSPKRDWFALGFKGLAPYMFEVDATAYVGESGRFAFNFQAEYEYLFTQRLILTPEVEMNLYGKNDEERGIGSGLSDLSFGLRLRYELAREFAPYIGVNWWHKYGNTADYARAEGEDRSATEFVLGVRAWF